MKGRHRQLREDSKHITVARAKIIPRFYFAWSAIYRNSKGFARRKVAGLVRVLQAAVRALLSVIMYVQTSLGPIARLLSTIPCNETMKLNNSAMVLLQPNENTCHRAVPTQRANHDLSAAARAKALESRQSRHLVTFSAQNGQGEGAPATAWSAPICMRAVERQRLLTPPRAAGYST